MDEYRWPLLGGHLALDLCNTVSWRRDPARAIDRLPDPARLAAWYAAATGSEPVAESAAGPENAGRRARGEGRSGEEALAAVKQLREATAAVVQAHLEGDVAPRRELDLLMEAARDATRRAEPSRALPLTWSIDVRKLEDVPAALALSISDLLTADPSRLKECAGAGCGWFFLDTTRNHSRRWCDPDDCGNRARVRAYAERQRQFDAR